MAGIRNVAQKADDALSCVDCAGGVAKAKKSPLLPCSACASSETIAEPFLWSHVAPSAALSHRLVQRDALAVPSTASTVGCAAPSGRVGVGMPTGALAVRCCPDTTDRGQCGGATAACSPGCGGVETGLIQQRRCVSVHGRSGAPRLNWCSPGWYWLSCTGRQVQHSAWRGWSALVVWQRSARERIRIFRKHSERRHAERVLGLWCSWSATRAQRRVATRTFRDRRRCAHGASWPTVGLSLADSHRAVGGASLGEWCFEYPVNFRAPFACMVVSNTREEERHKQGGCDPVGFARLTCRVKRARAVGLWHPWARQRHLV